MLGLFGWISAAIGSAASVFFFWRKLRKHYATFKKYYSIIVILADAIEAIEKISGVVPDNLVVVSKAVKGLVYRALSKEDRQILDDILLKRGYIHKRGGVN